MGKGRFIDFLSAKSHREALHEAGIETLTSLYLDSNDIETLDATFPTNLETDFSRTKAIWAAKQARKSARC